jgi:predicted kinase
MRAIITIGVSCSGKSSWAREYAKKHKAIISNRDDLRFSLTGATNWSEYKFDKKIEDMITMLQRDIILRAAARQKDVIIADTNLDFTRREEVVAFCKSVGYDTIEYQPFPITLEEAWKRDALRPNGVGRDVIYKQWKQWLKFTGRKVYEPDESLPKAVIFDVDGTLAHMNGRGPFEWDKVGEDSLDLVVYGMLQEFLRSHYTVIVVSGRDGVCKEQTKKWLSNHGIHAPLFMRKPGDIRKDSIIKEEIFWEHTAPYYNVQAVVDDRPQVVRMWYDIGIPKVICVGNPYEEF